MIHVFRLDKIHFDKVKDGTKTVEMRLYDEKRKHLRVGDQILFRERDNELNKVRTIIRKIEVYKNFNELYGFYNKVALGYDENQEANPKDMEKYYPIEKQNEFGVVAITIELDKTLDKFGF